MEPMRHTRAACAIVALTCATIAAGVAWACTTELDTVAHAPGTVVVDGSNRRAMHAEGGSVESLLVKVGDRVEAGQPLVRLSPIQAKAKAADTRARLGALDARIERLTAQAEGRAMRSVEGADPDAWAAERATFDAAAAALDARLAVLSAQASKAQSEARSLRDRIVALKEQEDVLAKTLALHRQAVAAGGSPARLLEIENQIAGVRAQSGGLPAQAEGAEAAAREAQGRLASERADVAAKARDELAKVRAEAASLRAVSEGEADRVERTEVRSPVRGIVQALTVTAVGEVVPPGGVVAEIVPVSDGLMIEARVRPEDVDGVVVGMPASVSISAFGSSRRPLEGKLVSLSADTSEDRRTGARYYTARVRTDEDAVDGKQIGPGMTADVVLVGGSRTVAAYFADTVAPFSRRALRDK